MTRFASLPPLLQQKKLVDDGWPLKCAEGVDTALLEHSSNTKDAARHVTYLMSDRPCLLILSCTLYFEREDLSELL